ncbi:MAG: type II secretion system F family protein [Proteobacteria bacterium]|nr:type II secretion system F family protein [Pseudomonadota bacterium]
MRFKYSALDQRGKKENGFIDADTEGAAKTVIKNRDLFLVSLQEFQKISGKKQIGVSFGMKQRLPIKLARQLASLLKGGVPLFQALTIITNQLDIDKEREIVSHLRDQVKSGFALSDALKTFPDIFDELFVYSVQAGEKSGSLDLILNYQANLLENHAVIRGKIKAALVYPLIMSIVGTGVVLFLIGYVVPMVIKIFERMSQGLPIPTKILIAITNLVNNYYYIIFIIPLFLFFGFEWFRKTREGKRLWHKFLLDAPVAGSFYLMVLAGRFTRILGTLLKSGIPMLQGIIVVSNTMKNIIVSEAVMKIAGMVEGGVDLSVAIRDTGTFPPYVADMVNVGETSGNLDEILTNVSEYYDSNINQRITAFTAMVEPVIILLMGTLIAFILVSILLPLFEMNKILLKR